MNDREPSIVLDGERLQREIEARGMTVKSFAEAVGLHRDTLQNYLSGRVRLPDGLDRILGALQLEPAQVLRLTRRRRQVPGLAVSELVSELAVQTPGAAFVLFGSRARGQAKRYSDYDIGVYAGAPLDFAHYSRLLDRVAEWNEGCLQTAELVDLGRADAGLLQRIVADAVFLGGSHESWCRLLHRAEIETHE